MADVEQTAISARRQAYVWMAGVALAYLGSMWLLNKGLSVDRPLEELFIHRPCTAKNYYTCWVGDKSNSTLTFILHTLPNLFFTGVGIAAALGFAGSFSKQDFFVKRVKPFRELALMVLVGVGGVSLLVAQLKNYTGHYCPAQLAFFGGPVGDVPPVKPSPECFPAGHPSPGFGLLVLYFSVLPRFWRMFGLYAGIASGSILGIIQMVRGEHFLSHNIATALTAIFFGCAVYFVNTTFRGKHHETAGH